MLAKGTKVLVRTTNGGELVAQLALNYRPTYDAVLELNGRTVVISPWRLKSIDPHRSEEK